MLWILTVTMVLSLVMLTGIMLIILNFKVWAQNRDKYYAGKFDDLEKRVKDLEEKHLGEVAAILKENKDILERVRKEIPKRM